MKLIKFLLPIIAVIVLSSAYAQISPDIENVDLGAFRIYSEDQIEKEGTNFEGLSIGGDVRAKWIHDRKLTRGYKTRGTGAVNPVNVTGATIPIFNLPETAPIQAPNDRYEVEANLEAEMLTRCSWFEFRLRFKDAAGVLSGTEDGISLQRAWMGYTVWENSCGDFVDIEIGRKKSFDLFDSKIQYDTTYDGILITYESKVKHVGEFFLHGGPCIVDYYVNHYAWIVEGGVYRIADSGLYAKYSLTNWRKRGVDRNGVFDPPETRFVNSQILLGYNIPEGAFCVNTRFYGAFLVNHAAKKTRPVLPRKTNLGWYLGIQLGKVEHAGDWLIDINYQAVGYTAVPSFDVSGSGRGNRRGLDTLVVADTTNSDYFTNPQDVTLVPFFQLQGNTNYQALSGRAYYNITEDLVVKAQFDISRAWHTEIGGHNKFQKFELATVYSF